MTLTPKTRSHPNILLQCKGRKSWESGCQKSNVHSTLGWNFLYHIQNPKYVLYNYDFGAYTSEKLSNGINFKGCY